MRLSIKQAISGVQIRIALGNTNKEIADKLYIQPDTVNKHKKILNKLNLNNVASLIKFANETGLA